MLKYEILDQSEEPTQTFYIWLSVNAQFRAKVTTAAAANASQCAIVRAFPPI